MNVITSPSSVSPTKSFRKHQNESRAVAEKLRRRRSCLASAAATCETLETRMLLTAALVQSVSATPVISEAITPVANQTLTMGQFNPATGTLVGASVAYATDAHINIQSTITNPANQPVVTGSYTGSVTTTISVPGQASFPAVALTSTVSQPTTTFTVNAGVTGDVVASVNLTDPLTGSFNLTPSAATTAGYVGTGSVQDPTFGFPKANGTGSAQFNESGGGNETATTTKFAHTTATLSANYYYYVPGSISGLKFIDINGNGVKDSGDPVEAGFVFDLNGTAAPITGGGNTLVAGGAIAQQQATTLANGTYSFANLAPGTYTVSEDASNFLAGHIGRAEIAPDRNDQLYRHHRR